MAQYFIFCRNDPCGVKEQLNNFSFQGRQFAYNKNKNLYEIILDKTEVELTPPHSVSGLVSRTLNILAQTDPIYEKTLPFCQFGLAQYQLKKSQRETRKKLSEQGKLLLYCLTIDLTSPVIYYISKEDKGFKPSHLKVKKKK